MPAPRISLDNLSPSVRDSLLRQTDFFAATAPKQEVEKTSAERQIEKAVEEKPKKKGKKRTCLTPDEASTLVKDVKILDGGNTVKFILALDANRIPTAQQKGAFVGKDNHVHFFTKSPQRKAEKALEVALSPYAHLTRSWGDVPVELTFKFFFAYPEGTPKKDRHKIGEHTVRPDGDNIIKGPCDAMSRAGFWADDCYIDNYHIYKRRTSGPACTTITITNLRPKFDALYTQEADYDRPTIFSPTPSKPSETNPLTDLSGASCRKEPSNGM